MTVWVQIGTPAADPGLKVRVAGLTVGQWKKFRLPARFAAPARRPRWR